MKRKLVKQGNNALTITLPSKWIKKLNLKAGNEVEVEQKDNSVIVNAQKAQEHERMEITIPSADKFMRRLIHEWYILGYDELKVNFNDAKTIELIHKIVEELLGFEIVEQGTNYCVIKNVSSAMESEFDVLLRRIFLVIISMSDDILNSIREKDFGKMTQIANVEKITNKHAFFCERLLIKNGYAEFKKTPIIFAIVWSLEQIADEYKGIANTLNDKCKIGSQTIDLFMQTNELFKLFNDCFYKPSIEQLYKLKENQASLYNKLLESLSKGKNEEINVLHYLLKICDKLDHMGQIIL